MASSRIFIKGLPPTFTESDFKRHFSQQNRDVTDAKIFKNRRIGYIGYKTPEDAQKAVKHFNKSFIRMSRIGVEIARPIQDAKDYQQSGGRNGSAPTARRGSAERVDGLIGTDEGGSKRKRPSEAEEEQDPKLKEFLDVMRPKSKKKAWESEDSLAQDGIGGKLEDSIDTAVDAGESEEEYEAVPKKTKPSKKTTVTQAKETREDTVESPRATQVHGVGNSTQTDVSEDVHPSDQPAMSDMDWTRSRTSRLLGLLDDDEAEADAQHDQDEDVSDQGDAEPSKGASKIDPPTEAESSMPTPPSENKSSEVEGNRDTEDVTTTLRLFVRNLSYDVKEQELEEEFEHFGRLEGVHVPLDTKTGAGKGFAYIEFSDPDSAAKAIREKDGQIFQGRLLHILPANKKRDTKLDDFALSKLPLKKQQQVKRRREAASTTFNWNALYMNADAVVSSIADRLGLAKSEVLDPTSSDAAIKQAHAETHIIQESKAYFKKHSVDLDAFKKSQRGDTAILIKNIPYDCSKDELRRLFEEHGELKQFLMPPSGTIAIIEFTDAAQCQVAFSALAYRKIKSSVLFLEKAPKGLFDAKLGLATEDGVVDGVTKTSASDLKHSDHPVPDSTGSATLFVRNLNFSTTTQQFTETFKPLAGFMTARVKTKTDPKKPGQVLSMGFGFLEFRTTQQAQAALKAMDGYTLESHKLQIRASHKGMDAAEQRRKADAEKRTAGKKTKVIIKNLPFEATKKDVRALFGAYGQLRSVRVPKKMDRAARGFAFAEFTTPKEAESAMDTLRDTHLLGRRLVLDFAEGDAEDAEAEIEKMQAKVGRQVDKMALQKLTGGGRKKFSTQNDEEDL